MNTIFKKVFTVEPNHRSNKEIIRWWERRRMFYNAIMLAAGFVTIILAISLGEISFRDTINVLPPVLIFAFSANLFYTLGWMLEIVCSKFISEKEILQKAGPLLFIAGISLSVFFTIAIDIALLITFFFGSKNPS
jgi:hypothetical protein